MFTLCATMLVNSATEGVGQAFSNGSPWAKSGLQTILIWPFVNFKTHRST